MNGRRVSTVGSDSRRGCHAGRSRDGGQRSNDWRCLVQDRREVGKARTRQRPVRGQRSRGGDGEERRRLRGRQRQPAHPAVLRERRVQGQDPVRRLRPRRRSRRGRKRLGDCGHRGRGATVRAGRSDRSPRSRRRSRRSGSEPTPRGTSTSRRSSDDVHLVVRYDKSGDVRTCRESRGAASRSRETSRSPRTAPSGSRTARP